MCHTPVLAASWSTCALNRLCPTHNAAQQLAVRGLLKGKIKEPE